MAGRRFDQHLPRVLAAELKKMARLWGGHAKMRKEESIATIREGLADPVRVRGAIAQLDPLERCALAVLKQAGGEIEYHALVMALRVSGWKIPRSRYGEPSNTDVINVLAQRGFLLTTCRGNPASVYEHSGESVLAFSDPRMLAQAGAPHYCPLEISPSAFPTTVAYRSPPEVVLDLIGALRAVEHVGGLGTTQKGTVRVNDVRKVARAMRQENGPSGVEAFPFSDAAQVLVHALVCSELLSLKGTSWTLSASLDEFAESPYAEQVRPVAYGLVKVENWSEWDALPSYEMRHLPQARAALLAALAALPVDGDTFYGIDDLGWALFERIGGHFSFRHVPYAPRQYRQTVEEYAQELEAWRERLRQGWQESEQKWLIQALSTWLYYLGVVELGLDRHVPVSVRLTALGRALLHPELETALSAQPDVQGAAWVIQPNFEVVVYLDQARPDQLAFLERHADRMQAQRHMAQYRLTRDSVYRGLESGTSLDELLEGLRAGTNQALPQNVEVEVREWASLREQITLYRRARLIAFSSPQARQAALQAGASGVLLGDRYLRLAPSDRAPPVRSSIDYARPLPRCVLASEDGRILVPDPLPDLLIAAQLDIWAERVHEDIWQFTASSVEAAIREGRRIDELLDLLDTRSRRSIPELLRLALRAWAGERTTVHMRRVTVLKCPTPEIFEAVKASARLEPYLCGVLAPDLLLVDTDQVDALRMLLAWAGVEVVDTLPVRKDRLG